MNGFLRGMGKFNVKVVGGKCRKWYVMLERILNGRLSLIVMEVF